MTISQQTGYLLINLGTPKSPTKKDVRAYLNEFLMDRYVIDTPWVLRRLLVSAFILPFRPSKSSAAYASIWSEQGSPLLVFSEALRLGLAQQLGAPVALGMRYGEPSIEHAIDDLLHQGVDNLTVIPLYPQYADSTVTTSIQRVKALLPKHIKAHFVDAFYSDEGYLQALATSVRRALPEKFDHLLLSYHGLPERQLTKADATGTHCLRREDCCSCPSEAHATCYRHQVFATSNALIEVLELDPERVSISFQSRLGRLPWLQPYTDQVLAELPARGVKHIAVACPAFVADNLETLEEMGIRGRQIFLDAGGESFHLIPCLNDDSAWLEALATLARSAANEQS